MSREHVVRRACIGEHAEEDVRPDPRVRVMVQAGGRRWRCTGADVYPSSVHPACLIHSKY